MANAEPRTAETIDTAEFDVLLVGMGYVGVTLTAAMLESGYRVLGYENKSKSARLLDRGELTFDEPQVGDVLRRFAGSELRVVDSLAGFESAPPVVIICVGTPVRDDTRQPDLSQLTAALEAVGPLLDAETLVVIRSTVPIGTNAGFVTETLRRYVPEPLLASAPERTIQGRALEESRNLPQIVGASSAKAQERAEAFFRRIAARIVPVTSTKAAEAIKLICNCHTDVIYGFGNEVARFAEKLGLDAMELVSAANLDYPRPDLHRPGYVAGSCLTKDPYLLAASLSEVDYRPELILAARSLNEETPRSSARRVLGELRSAGVGDDARILITGIAYKGVPETDDVRGAAYPAIIEVLERAGITDIVCHDNVLDADRLRALGLEAVSLEEGAVGASAIMVLNNHPWYAEVDFAALRATMAAPQLIYDVWGVVDAPELEIVRLGRA